MGIDIVSYAMGAAGKAKIISATDWDAMTPEEQAKCGLVAVMTNDEGYYRGYLAYGKALGRTLISNHELQYVALEEFWDTFKVGDTTWGSFDAHGTAIDRNNADECIMLANNTWLSKNILGESNFTIYGVTKRTTSDTYRKVFLAAHRVGTNEHNMITTKGSEAGYSYYSAAFSAFPDVLNTDWHAYAMAVTLDPFGVRKFYDTTKFGGDATQGPGTDYDIFSISANSLGQMWQATSVKYCAVVKVRETDEEILENLGRICEYFGIGET